MLENANVPSLWIIVSRRDNFAPLPPSYIIVKHKSYKQSIEENKEKLSIL